MAKDFVEDRVNVGAASTKITKQWGETNINLERRKS
jgi:hypothetical protein